MPVYQSLKPHFQPIAVVDCSYCRGCPTKSASPLPRDVRSHEITDVADRQRTPFNIGRAIQLKGFKEHEAQPLLQGLTEKVDNPQTVLREILAWTSDQPFLTQKLCQLICNASSPIPANQEAEWIADLVQTNIVDNRESQNELKHLRTIRDRLFNSPQSTLLRELYQQIRHRGEMVAVNMPKKENYFYQD